MVDFFPSTFLLVTHRAQVNSTRSIALRLKWKESSWLCHFLFSSPTDQCLRFTRWGKTPSCHLRSHLPFQCLWKKRRGWNKTHTHTQERVSVGRQGIFGHCASTCTHPSPAVGPSSCCLHHYCYFLPSLQPDRLPERSRRKAKHHFRRMLVNIGSSVLAPTNDKIRCLQSCAFNFSFCRFHLEETRVYGAIWSFRDKL